MERKRKEFTKVPTDRYIELLNNEKNLIMMRGKWDDELKRIDRRNTFEMDRLFAEIDFLRKVANHFIPKTD